MMAYFSLKNMKKLVAYLSEKFNLSVIVSQSVYDDYFDKKDNVIRTKTALQEKAEKIFEEDKSKFEQRQKQKESSQKPKANSQMPTVNSQKPSAEKAKRIRIAKAKATAKLKLLALVKV